MRRRRKIYSTGDVALARLAGTGYAASHSGTAAPNNRTRGRAGDRRLALRRVWRFNGRMSDTQIDFSAPAKLRKWPSLNKQRVSASLGARPYVISEGTLVECIQQFMQLREAQRHLYEIHTAPQFYRRTTSLSWRGSRIFSENRAALDRRPCLTPRPALQYRQCPSLPAAAS
jgi:hypothetical protein